MSHNYKKNFIDLCVSGECLLEDMDDFIDEWHDGDYHNELHEFLGMSWDEYGSWLADSGVLPIIIESRRSGADFKMFLNKRMAHCAGFGKPVENKEGNPLV